MPQPDSKPRLAPHVRRQADRVTGGVMLLHPEGAVELSETADAIVQLCDGARTTAEIVAALATEFEIDPEELRGDVLECLDGLISRSLVVA
jgi:pyrroloquinoline quinone biosynthesis protein D